MAKIKILTTSIEKSTIGDIVYSRITVSSSSFLKYSKVDSENDSIKEIGNLDIQISLNDYFNEDDYKNHPSKLIEYIKKAKSVGAEILYIRERR